MRQKTIDVNHIRGLYVRKTKQEILAGFVCNHGVERPDHSRILPNIIVY